MNLESYGTPGAIELLPVAYTSFERIPAGKQGYWLGGFDSANALTAPFKGGLHLLIRILIARNFALLFWGDGKSSLLKIPVFLQVTLLKAPLRMLH